MILCDPPFIPEAVRLTGSTISFLGTGDNTGSAEISGQLPWASSWTQFVDLLRTGDNSARAEIGGPWIRGPSSWTQLVGPLSDASYVFFLFLVLRCLGPFCDGDIELQFYLRVTLVARNYRRRSGFSFGSHFGMVIWTARLDLFGGLSCRVRCGSNALHVKSNCLSHYWKDWD